MILRIKMICITCEHNCHCGDTCQMDGCGCPTVNMERRKYVKKIMEKV